MQEMGRSKVLRVYVSFYDKCFLDEFLLLFAGD